MLLLDLSFSLLFGEGFSSSLHRANLRAAHNVATGLLEKKQEGSPRWNPHVFYDLILEVTHFYFCHMLMVTQTNPGIIWEETTPGYEYSEVGPTGHHLAGPHIK